ncbi:MAG: PGPGW domain-containing protein [Nitrospirota bacterium]
MIVNEDNKKDPKITTVQQAKRLIKIVIGFTILLGGCIMLVTPGPGIPTVVGGLAILATEFVWAKRLMKRFKAGADHIKNSVLNNTNNKSK